MKNCPNKTIAALGLMPMLALSVSACVADMAAEEAGSASESSAIVGVVVRSAAGAEAADIQQAVDRFRIDVGEGNNGDKAGTQPTGHREIAWDGEPAELSSPNDFPGDGFLRRGCLMDTPGGIFQVSANASEADQAPPLFGNLNPAFPNKFDFFSAEKLFASIWSTITVVTFTVPGSRTRATVNGFGTVFTDVDLKNVSKVDFFDESGRKIHTEWAKAVPNKNKSLSFVGVTFKNGKRIGKVVITSGNLSLSSRSREDAWRDFVALDDFLYSEPQIATARH